MVHTTLTKRKAGLSLERSLGRRMLPMTLTPLPSSCAARESESWARETTVTHIRNYKWLNYNG